MADQKDAPAAEGLSLSRWSRLKRQAAAAPTGAAVAQPIPVHAERSEGPEASTESSNPALRSGRTGHDSVGNLEAELKLPPLSSISLTEDFTPFMQAKVPQALKQQAFKALFKEPHFNVMDRLDIYIDDYTQFEPISPEVMNTLSSWKTIMNPPKQVVTDAGYAVDEASEEGKAVLAARAKLAEEGASATDETASTVADSLPCESIADNSPPQFIAVTAHARHGKRVGEFAYVDAPLISNENDASVATNPTDATSTEKLQ